MHFETRIAENNELFDPEAHGQKCIQILNKSTKSKAKSSLPDLLSIKKVDDHFSVFAKFSFSKASQFGPLEAPLVTKNEIEETNFLIKLDVGKCNRLENSDKSYIYYDTTDENMCNWMMFVQPAKSYVEQNLCAHQKEDFIFFTSVRDILPDEELKVWYAPSYAKFLQVSVLTPSSGLINPPKIAASKLKSKKSKTSIRMQCYSSSQKQERDNRSVPPKKRVWRRSRDTRQIEGYNGNNRFLSHGEPSKVIRKTFVKIPKMHECDVCGKSFKTKHKLRIHSVIHSDARMFLCHHCGSTFKRQDKLRDHIINLHVSDRGNRKERNVKPGVNLDAFFFKCDDCGKGFQRRGMFVNHLIKMHPGMQTNNIAELACPIYKPVRDYLCPYCKKVYKSSTKRKLHIEKVHPGRELPVSLRNVRNGDTHANQPDINIVTRDQVPFDPFFCPHCERQYSSRHKMNKHIKEKHSKMSKNDSLPQFSHDTSQNVSTGHASISNTVQNTQNGEERTVIIVSNNASEPLYTGAARGHTYEIGNMPVIPQEETYQEQCETRPFSNGLLNHNDQHLLNQATISPLEVEPVPQQFTTLQNSNATILRTPANPQFLPEQPTYTSLQQTPEKGKAYSRYPLGRKQIIIKYQESQNQLQNASKIQQSQQKETTYIDNVLSTNNNSWQEVPITHCEPITVSDIPVLNVNHTYNADSNQPNLVSILNSESDEGTTPLINNVTQNPVLNGGVVNTLDWMRL